MVWETRGKGPRDRRCWRRRAGLLFVVAGCVAALIAVVGGSAVGASGHRRASVRLARGVTARDVARPSLALLAKARAVAAREHARRGSRAARVARMRSRRAFSHVSRSGAVSVARRRGGGVVDAPVWAPLRLRHGERLLGFVGKDQAQIALANGKRARVESTLPLRAKNAAGDLAPVDLSFADRGSFFSPGNPLTALRVGKRLGDGISLGDVGVRVLPVGAGDVRGSLVSGTPFWANVATDTDMLVKPLPAGAESFWQLRSQESPEQLRLKLDLPAGAQLRLASAGAGDAAGPEAAEVVKAGKVLAKIAAPGTRDADGQAVPTSMRVDGQDIVVTVAHHGRDVAYPLMVDPTMTVSEPDWYASNSSDFDGWVWVSGNTSAGARPVSACYSVWWCSYSFFGFPDFQDEPNHCVGNPGCNGGWGRGLYTVNSGYYAPAGEWAQWAFVAGNAGPEINIARAELKDAWSNNGCSPAGCGIAHIQGLWRQTNWVSMWLTTSGYNYSQKAYCSPATCDVPSTGQNAVAVVQQIATWTGGYFPSNFDFLASASLVISDDTGPNSLTVSHSNQPPSDWVQDTNETVTASAADGGVGVKEFDVTAHKPDGSTQTLASAVNPCPGNRHGWCPPNWTADIPYNTQGLPEGDNTFTITAKDAWGNQTDSTPWHAKIDRTPPTSQASGALFDHRNQASDHRSEGLYDSAYALHINGTDGFSGTSSIEVFVDDQSQASRGGRADNTCGSSGCPGALALNWTLSPDDYPDGPHTVKVVVKDQLADQPNVDSSKHTTVTSFQVLVDRRGDIYHATQYTADPATGGDLEADEWARIGTRVARREDESHVRTRGPGACDSGTCDEVRTRTRASEENAAAYDSYTTYTGGSVDDPRLEQIAEILQPADALPGVPTQTGRLADVLQAWQVPPPAHGDGYAMYEETHHADESDASSPSATTRTWVETKTQMPVKTELVDDAQASVLSTHYWTYSPGRLDQNEVAPDFFQVGRPEHVSYEKHVSMAADGSTSPEGSALRQSRTAATQSSPPMPLDQETGAIFRPFSLGSTPTVGAGTLCLAGRNVTRDNDSAPSTIPTTPADPEASGRDLRLFTTAEAYYNLLPAVALGSCIPGRGILNTPDLEVISMARNSSQAAAQRDAYMTAGTPITLPGPSLGGPNPLGLTDPLGPTVAYALPETGADGTSVLLDTLDTTVLITGRFSKDEVALICQLLREAPL